MSTPDDPARAMLSRSRIKGLPAVIVGERGSGKSTLAIQSMPEGWVGFDARSAADDPDAWMINVERACCTSSAVLLRHLDHLPPPLHGRLREILDNSSAWCVATAISSTLAAEASILDDFFVVVVERSALRERRDELAVIVARMLSDLAVGGRVLRCSPDVLAVFARHRWSGNVSQLRRVLATSAMTAASGEITLADVPASVLAEAGTRDLTKLERLERELVLTGLQDANWNREEAANALGISRATMYRKLKQFEIIVPSSRS